MDGGGAVTLQRVLMTTDAVGGVWRYSLDLGGTLRARGFATTLAVMGPSPSAMQRMEAADSGLELVDRPYRLEWMDDPWSDVERAGAWLMNLADQLQPFAVHLNGYAHAALPWRVPTMVVAHSCVRSWWRAVRREPAPDRLARYRDAVRSGLSAASLVVAPTAAMATAVRAEYDVAAPIRVVPNGCAPRDGRGCPWPDKQRIVLAAGRTWDEAKNITALSDAAADLEWPIYVAGESHSPAGATTACPHVRLLGALPAAEMAWWYDQAAIYAHPARYEPFGLSVLEAAAAGCALVLGNISSLRENWSGAAIFVDPDDRDALRSALTELIARPAARRRLGERAQARASRFTIDRTAAEYARLYRMLRT
jgi:glycogen synthase